jgi:hypothetical protein
MSADPELTDKRPPLNVSDVLALLGFAGLCFTLVYEGTHQYPIAIAVAVFVAVVSAILWIQIRKWEMNENTYRWIFRTEGIPTREIVALLSAATETIRLTHYTPEVPTDTYTSAMIQRIQAGVSVVRIVDSKTLDNADIKKWTNRFKEHRRYTQIVVPWAPQPLDFTIIDDRIVLLYLPTAGQEYNHVMMFRSHKVARIFRNIFHTVESRGTVDSDIHDIVPTKGGVK